MKRIQINASHKYEVLIGKDLLERAGELSLAVCPPCRACVVTDDTVNDLYADTLVRSLEGCGYDTVKFVFAHGEASKNTATLISLLEFLASNELTRSDAVFALGGGVVGDLAGFASAIYLRGIPFIQLPTTLLAATDSSVGGKTAVDLAAGKNLAGAFHQPSLVICDVNTLDTLPEDIFADGCAEVIKYGVINDRPLFDKLKRAADNNIEEIIAACVEDKARLVESDEFDTGARQLLNLGHTIGHAIEACSHFAVSHGSAVAMGMTIAMRAAVSLGICAASELDELISLLKLYKLPTESPYQAKELAAAALTDKKRKGEYITLVVPYSIGDTRLQKIKITELENFIERGLKK